MGAKAWSKATPEQRERHRQSCIEAGKLRRMYNWVKRICDDAASIGVNGCDYLHVCYLAMTAGKLPCEADKMQKVIKLLQKKMKFQKVYQMVFERGTT